MENRALAAALLYDRNANWAEWIEARLNSTPGTVFIAVGAGHLAGERSVQDYLAEREIETSAGSVTKRLRDPQKLKHYRPRLRSGNGRVQRGRNCA